jgi:hypothetical protein
MLVACGFYFRSNLPRQMYHVLRQEPDYYILDRSHLIQTNYKFIAI